MIFPTKDNNSHHHRNITVLEIDFKWVKLGLVDQPTRNI
jgi:hypothetical protein